MNVLDLRGRKPSRRARPYPEHGTTQNRPPGQGEGFRTPIHDDERGIRFEIEKMVEYVKHYSGHPLVIRTARRIAELCEAKDKVCEMAALFAWTKEHYRYVNDPVDKEAIQTPVSMIRDITTPSEVLEAILGPELIERMNGFGVGHSMMGYQTGRVLAAACFEHGVDGLHPRASEDCDSGAVFIASLLASIGITPRFRFGGQKRGNACNYHHVWTQAYDSHSGKWVDMDVTESKSKLGWFFEGFGCTGHTTIFPGAE